MLRRQALGGHRAQSRPEEPSAWTGCLHARPEPVAAAEMPRGSLFPTADGKVMGVGAAEPRAQVSMCNGG